VTVSGERKALIVADDEYDQEALRNLVAPAADAEALGRVLGDRQIGGFTVQVMRNEPSYVIQAQIEELFLESMPDDVLLLHFSGHGLKSQSGNCFCRVQHPPKAARIHCCLRGLRAAMPAG
jgi:Caspase domain